MIKVTFTLDDESVSYLERMAHRLDRPKSQIVREALRVYGEQMSRLTEGEPARMLAVFDEVTPAIPRRPRAAVEREPKALREARSSGDARRRTTPRRNDRPRHVGRCVNCQMS